MRAVLILTMVAFLGPAAALSQSTDNSDRPMGRGRGGAPFAWNDKNKDGICDITGRPVGTGPRRGGIGGNRGRGRAAGPARRGCCLVQMSAGESQPEAPAAQLEKK